MYVNCAYKVLIILHYQLTVNIVLMHGYLTIE